MRLSLLIVVVLLAGSATAQRRARRGQSASAPRRPPAHRIHHSRLAALSAGMPQKKASADYYKMLGVPRSATDKQIKKAYHKLSMIHHPDKVSGEAEKEAATKRFTEIGEAYGTSARSLQA